MMTLAEYLKAKELTQREFARAVEVSASYMNEIVQGAKTPSMSVAAKIEALTDGEVRMASLIVSPKDAA
ncbi:helix-turn-helix domain-containing protein [Roseicitreum antarcticum]|nr:helix-turn-helix transcriptional regulator [Roseicitreum antarcticum]